MKIYLSTFLVILLLLLNIYLLVSVTNYPWKILSNVNQTNCSGMKLEDTTECLNNKLTKFFYYNISNSGKQLTESEFIEQGGVCSHASEWYKEQIMLIGNFSVTDIIIRTGKIKHQFVIVSNYEGYCILDMQYYNCVKFVI